MKLVIVLQLFIITPVTIFALPAIKGLSRFQHICPKYHESGDHSDIPEKTRAISNSNVIKVSDWQSMSTPAVSERSIEKPLALFKDDRLTIDIPLIATNDINENVINNKITGEEIRTEQAFDVVTPDLKEEVRKVEKIIEKISVAVDKVEGEVEKVQDEQDAQKKEVEEIVQMIVGVEEAQNVKEEKESRNMENEAYKVEEEKVALEGEEESLEVAVQEEARKVEAKENAQQVEVEEKPLNVEGEEKEARNVEKEEVQKFEGQDDTANNGRVRNMLFPPVLPFEGEQRSDIITTNKISSKHIGCVCALFNSKCPVQSDVPLMSKTYHNVSCHEQVSGEDACMKTCIAFTLSYYEMKDDMICSHAKNAVHLSVYLHSKMCENNDKWAFTGLMSPKSICCTEGTPVKCMKY